MRVCIAPDSFKGSLSAADAAAAIAQGLQAADPELDCVLAPMADGGEGTLDCVAAVCEGHWHRVRITAIHGQPIEAAWYALADGTAVIESAQALGLPLIQALAEPPPLGQRSSHALGLLLLDALEQGQRDIAIALGGSASNDAGLGLLVALGARAFDAHDQPLAPSMASLLALQRLDLSGLDARLADCRLRGLCDVDNPLLGDAGASRVYGPQKGLNEAEIADVEAAFIRLTAMTDSQALADLPGSGAAGGLGFALALLGAALESGADALIELTRLAATLEDVDLLITGEGRSDRQTLSGKLPVAVARLAHPTPAVLISGAVADDARAALAARFVAIHTLVENAPDLESAIAEPAHWLVQVARQQAGAWVRLAAEPGARL